MSASSKQWINGYDYSSINCGGTVQSYFSSSFGYCEQNNYTSSYIISGVSLSNGNVRYTDTEYNTNSQCSGSPSKVVTGTFPQCSNNETFSTGSSYGWYSITNSIPPLPAGLLYRSDCTSGSPYYLSLSPVNSCFYDSYAHRYYEYACNSKGYNYTAYKDASCLSTPLFSYYAPFNSTCSKTEYSDGYVDYDTYSCYAGDPTATPTAAPITATARAPTAKPTATPTATPTTPTAAPTATPTTPTAAPTATPTTPTAAPTVTPTVTPTVAPNTATVTSSKSSSSSDSDSFPVYAMIVLVVVVPVLLLIGIAAFFLCKQKKSEDEIELRTSARV